MDVEGSLDLPIGQKSAAEYRAITRRRLLAVHFPHRLGGSCVADRSSKLRILVARIYYHFLVTSFSSDIKRGFWAKMVRLGVRIIHVEGDHAD